jgi:tetratricopeptide (TPR) repeat protein
MLRLIWLAFLLGISGVAFSQLLGVEQPPQYKEAASLVSDALLKLNSGEIKQAEELAMKALNIYPTENFMDYIEAIYKLSDNKKASKLSDLFFEKIKSFPSGKIVIYESIFKQFKDYPLSTAMVNYSFKMNDINRGYATLAQTVKFLEKIVKIDIVNKDANHGYEYSRQQSLAIDLAVLKGNIRGAIDIASKKSNPHSYLANIHFATGHYEKVIEHADLLPTNDSAVQRKLKLLAYLMMGDNKADAALEQYRKHRDIYFKRSGTLSPDVAIFYYALAQYELKNKDFFSALRHLDSALYNPDARFSSGWNLVNRWMIFKSIGDVYAASQQYEKARDNYKIALLTNNKYEPAISALANLQSTIATQTATDKTPPSIKVTEPSAKRGLKVTVAANDVLVRGVAMDPSGLKSVSINGQDVYAQSSGDFWGNIQLKEGNNKIIIKATDGAGNISEQTFTIDKTATVATETDIIVPVSEKEGKNYCLLIAAQNYQDKSIPSLDNPIQDAMKLKIVLKSNYGFSDENIITLFNPEANDIKRKLLELTNTIQPEDNVLIFYAGHGIWVEKEKKGYWLMTDAKRNDVDTWVSNKDILELVSKLPSRHTLLITDACFSGGVFKTRSIGKDASASIQLMGEKISRVAITSGNDTEVPDESVFMRYLVKALNENKEKYLTAQKMFITHIMEAVMTETKTEPRYGTLELAGHVGGDFIFVKK